MSRFNLLHVKNQSSFDEFDLSEDIEKILINNNHDVTSDESDDDRPVSRMQFYSSSSESESEYPSSPDTVIINDRDFLEDHLDDCLPDLIPIETDDSSEEFYY